MSYFCTMTFCSRISSSDLTGPPDSRGPKDCLSLAVAGEETAPNAPVAMIPLTPSAARALRGTLLVGMSASPEYPKPPLPSGSGLVIDRAQQPRSRSLADRPFRLARGGLHDRYENQARKSRADK